MRKRFQISDLRCQILAGVVIVDVLLQMYLRGLGRGVLNKGVSFGLLPGMGQEVAMVVYLALLIFLGLTITKLARVNSAIWLLVAGGLGNLLPRLLWGGVWDYIHVPLLPFWFNISDLMITCGVLLYGWSEIATARVRDSQ